MVVLCKYYCLIVGLVSASVVTVLPIERECPSGSYTLIDDLCVQKSVYEPEYECRMGGNRIGDHCVTEERYPSEIMCVDGFVFNGLECEMAEQMGVELYCEPEDVLENGECIKVEQIATRPSCPKGYLYNGSRCEHLTTSKPLYKCPEPWEHSGPTTCVKKVQNECPVGSMVLGKECLSTVDTLPIIRRNCLSGGELDATGRCVSVTTVEPDLTCPEGFSVRRDKCERPVVSKPLLRCPRDFDLVGNECIRRIQAEPYCHRSDERLTPQGSCLRVEQADVVPKCPQKSSGSGESKCVVKVIYSNEYETTCEEGYKLWEGHCVKSLPQVCPVNYHWHGEVGVCVRESKLQPSCHEDSIYDSDRSQCVTLTLTDPMIQCPRGSDYDHIQKSCFSHKVYPPFAKCPKVKMTIKKGKCVAQKLMPPKRECSHQDDVLDGGKCVRISRIPVGLKCTNSSHILDNNKCIIVTEVPAIKKCPIHFQPIANACVGKIPDAVDEELMKSNDSFSKKKLPEPPAWKKLRQNTPSKWKSSD